MLTYRTDVIIVDDSLAMRKIIRSQLSQIGLQCVREASDGEVAIQMLNMKKPDIILSDFEMKPVDGKQLLSYIRGHRRFANLPFVMVTGSIVRFADCGRDGGRTHYLAKPFRTIDLREKMIAAVG